MLDDAWRFAFFGGAGCSGAAIVVLSGASAGAASTVFNGSAAADADALAGALPGATGGADVVCAATGAAVFDNAAFGAAAFAVADIAGWLVAGWLVAGWVGTVVCKDARASGLSLGGAAATEVGGDAGLTGAVTVAGAVVGAAAVGATDGTAAVRTLVTIARAATGVFSGSLGRSTRESTTPAPAVAPIAVATRTTRAVRAKLGAGAK